MTLSVHHRRLVVVGLVLVLVAYTLTAIGVSLIAYPIMDTWPSWLTSTVMAVAPFAALFIVLTPPVTAIMVLSRWTPAYTRRNILIRIPLAGVGVFLTGLGTQLIMSATSGLSSIGFFTQRWPGGLAVLLWSLSWGALGFFFDWLIVGRHFRKYLDGPTKGI